MAFTPQPNRTVDFDVITEGFNLLFKHWQVYVIPGLIMFLLYVPYGIVSFMPLIGMFSGDFSSPANPFEGMFLQIVLAFIPGIASIFLYPGIVKYTLNVSRGAPASTSDLWEGFKDPLGYFAVAFITWLVAIAGFFVCCIGVFVAVGVMMFALPLKVDTRRTASQCVAESWEMLKPHWLMASVLMLVVYLIAQLGTFACYIGLVLTIPFAYIAPTLLYNRFVGYTPVAAHNPASPYPRGQQTGSGIGEQPAPPLYDPLKPEGPPE
jgi:hypothetical protein